MSDDFLETIWAQYAVETEEHIESIESLLVKADAEALNAEEISGLFRAFHSLKGLSRVMELTALESIAHRAEDLLGLVRDGQAALDKPTVDLLLRSLDAIKLLRDRAVSERSDGDKPAELLKELEAAYRAVSAGGSVAAAAPAPATEAAPEPEQAMAPSASGQAAPAPMIEAASLGLGDDEAREVVFLRQISQGLPVLEQLALSIASNQTPAEIFSVANDMRMPLKWMLKSTDSLGYIGLHDRIQDILDALPDNAEMNREGIERMVDAIVTFLDDLKTLGETTGVNLGGDSLSKVLSHALQENLRFALDQIAQDLQTLERREDNEEDLSQRLSQQFTRLNGYLASLYPDMASDLPLLLVDAFGRTLNSELNMYGELIALAREACQLMRGWLQAKGKNPLKAADAQAEHDALGQRLRGYLWSLESAGQEPVQDARAFVAGMNVPPELAELLSLDNMRDFMAQVQGGAHAYLLMAHLESSEEIGSAFLGWVHDKGSVITNRTVFIDDQSWYEILFISAAPFAQVQADLHSLDGGLGVIRLVAELGGAAASATAGGASTAAPAAANAPAARAGSTAQAATSNVIRVPGEMLDQFMNQIGEMVLVRGQLAHIIADHARARQPAAHAPWTGRTEQEHRRSLHRGAETGRCAR